MSKIKGIKTITEIKEQPKAIESVIANIDALVTSVTDIMQKEKPERVIFAGCGTSHYLALSAAAVFSRYNTVPAIAVTCSDLYFYPDSYIKDAKTLVVPFTRRSGTSEVKMAINKVREYPNVVTMSITCDEGSKDYNDYMLLSPNAKEESVIMTKSYTSMLVISTIFALVCGGKSELLEHVIKMPGSFAAMMDRFESIARDITKGSPFDLYIFLGQGPLFGVASEAMIKVKEMVITNSECYSSLEYRHGPISIADKDTFVTVLTDTVSEGFERALLTEVKGIGAKTLVIGNTLAKETKNAADYYIELNIHDDISLILPAFVITLQMIGYYAAIEKDIDLDSPKNLSLAVILEPIYK